MFTVEAKHFKLDASKDLLMIKETSRKFTTRINLEERVVSCLLSKLEWLTNQSIAIGFVGSWRLLDSNLELWVRKNNNRFFVPILHLYSRDNMLGKVLCIPPGKREEVRSSLEMLLEEYKHKILEAEN